MQDLVAVFFQLKMKTKQKFKIQQKFQFRFQFEHFEYDMIRAFDDEVRPSPPWTFHSLIEKFAYFIMRL
jgi:hypothetical protein